MATYLAPRGKLDLSTVLFQNGRIVRVTQDPTDNDPLHYKITVGVQHGISLGDLHEIRNDLVMGRDEETAEGAAFIVTGVDDNEIDRLTVGQLIETAWLLISSDGNWVFHPRPQPCNWTPMQLPGGARLLNRGRCGVLVTQRGLTSFRGALITPVV